ncbi:MAG: hypothetical protein MZU95_07845 [Desulfomicrobium escambiense]|nr:hypothetical protein [Desulfomicrobium escambiense]
MAPERARRGGRLARKADGRPVGPCPTRSPSSTWPARTIPAELIRAAIRGQTTVRASVVPVLCGASRRNIGVQPLLDAVVDYLPSPDDVPPARAFNPKKEEDLEVPCEPDGQSPGPRVQGPVRPRGRAPVLRAHVLGRHQERPARSTTSARRSASG